METTGGYYSRKRARKSSVEPGRLHSVTRVPGQKPTESTNSYPVSVVGRQFTVSRDNNFSALMGIKRSKGAHINSKRAVSALDIGGNFFTTDNQLLMTHRNFTSTVKTGFTTRSYGGPLFANGSGLINENSAVWPTVPVPSDDYLRQLGATAIARCEPTNPHADLATAIAEVVREGMPSIPFKDMIGAIRKRKLGEQSGGEHLNIEFAIKPIVAELRKFAEAVVKSDEIMRQYDRDSGREVRRSYYFPTETSEEVLSSSPSATVYPTLPTVMYPGGVFTNTMVKTRKTTVETWFSGAFLYRVPYVVFNGETNFERDVTRARKLLGVRLDAEVIWNLAPWSWFADWFTNCGDVIHNAAAFANDDLVMRYGYLMMRTTIEDTYTHRGLNFYDGPTGEIRTTFRTVQKTRTKAHPLGFGIDVQDLTARQIAILAALGLTQSGK